MNDGLRSKLKKKSIVIYKNFMISFAFKEVFNQFNIYFQLLFSSGVNSKLVKRRARIEYTLILPGSIKSLDVIIKKTTCLK